MSFLFDFVRKRHIADDWSCFLGKWIAVQAQSGATAYGKMVKADPDGILLRPHLCMFPKSGSFPAMYSVEDRSCWVYGWHLGSITEIDEDEYRRRWMEWNKIESGAERVGPYG